MTIKVPPIKCQGIKTKLVGLIKQSMQWDGAGYWIEPFTGSGVVGFNVAPQQAIFADTNPHLIRFYKDIQQGAVNHETVKAFLIQEGEKLLSQGEEYYYQVRSRFNLNPNSLDFLFLNRSCFNGVMRFNRKGGFNVPFCRKPNRFAQSYVTKIVNQVAYLEFIIRKNSWEFICQDFEATILMATSRDFVYADPPYVGRHVDYFDSWSEEKEKILFSRLHKTPAKFMLSTWEESSYRRNDFVDTLWSAFTRINKEHFYHVGAKEINRNTIKEALVMNYDLPKNIQQSPKIISSQIAFSV
jgi:DNA adenine methylase